MQQSPQGKKELDVFEVLKTRQQVPNGVRYGGPHVTKPRLRGITFSAAPRNGILTQTVRN